MPQAEQRSWARIVDLAHRDLPQLAVSHLTPVIRVTDLEAANTQTQEVFATEGAVIAAAATPLQWLRPSDHDPDRMPIGEVIAIEPGDAPETELPVRAGRVRGLVLHKLMEELFTGELVEERSDIAARARLLMTQLIIDADEDAQLPDPEEIAATIERTLALPEIARLRPSLVPEWPIYAILSASSEPAALAGRIDAIGLQDNQPVVVVDWKSDVSPSEQDVRGHSAQVANYLHATGVPRGAIVYMTTGVIRWVTASTPQGDA